MLSSVPHTKPGVRIGKEEDKGPLGRAEQQRSREGDISAGQVEEKHLCC